MPKCEHENCDKEAVWIVDGKKYCHKHGNKRGAMLIPKLTKEQAENLMGKLKAATGC